MTDTKPAASRRPEYLGEPTLGQVMRRPQWILALLFALVVAGGFAWLGRWQADSAFRDDTVAVSDTEIPRELSAVAAPGTGLTEQAAGSVVTVRGELVPGDLDIVAPRENQGESGAWVVGHLRTADPESDLAVAIGWAPSRSEAEAAAARLERDPDLGAGRELTGRLMPGEELAVPDPDQDPQGLSAMAPAQLVNRWQDVDRAVYAGYLVLHPEGDSATLVTSAGLDVIDSVPPAPPEQVNWLNVFYAIEWVVFAGFAIFFWFRLTRDAWEKEHELKGLDAAEGSGDPE